MDLTIVRTFLGGEFYLVAVFEACSRTPLAVQTFALKPGASVMARLLKAAARAFATFPSSSSS